MNAFFALQIFTNKLLPNIYTQKMRIIGLFILVTIFFNWGCKSPQDAQSSTKIPSDFFLAINHEGGKGPFPIYRIYVDANGVVQYQGESEVENIGRFQKKITTQQMQALMAAVDKADFWSMDEAYNDPNIMDLPSCTTEVTFNGKSHKVVNRYRAPSALINLEKELEKIIGKEGYKSLE